MELGQVIATAQHQPKKLKKALPPPPARRDGAEPDAEIGDKWEPWELEEASDQPGDDASPQDL